MLYNAVLIKEEEDAVRCCIVLSLTNNRLKTNFILLRVGKS